MLIPRLTIIWSLGQMSKTWQEAARLVPFCDPKISVTQFPSHGHLAQQRGKTASDTLFKSMEPLLDPVFRSDGEPSKGKPPKIPKVFFGTHGIF